MPVRARRRVGLTHRFLAWRSLAAGANLRDRRAGMVRLAPVAGLGAGLELHRLDVGTADDEIASDEPHGERGIGSSVA
jgi:hypothetical protein